MDLKTIKAGSLDLAYLDTGPGDGWPCVMCLGFPYDVHAFAARGAPGAISSDTTTASPSPCATT